VDSSSVTEFLRGHTAVSSTSNILLLGLARHVLSDEEDGQECVLLLLVHDKDKGLQWSALASQA